MDVNEKAGGTVLSVDTTDMRRVELHGGRELDTEIDQRPRQLKADRRWNVDGG